MGEQKEQQQQIFRAYLAMAVFCEKVLRESDNVLSVIRVIDRFNLTGATPEMQPAILQFTMLISFKSGFLRGKQKLTIRPKDPDGNDMASVTFPMLFEGDEDRGNALMSPSQFAVSKEGLYWWEIYLNDELVTRMPLRVAYQQLAAAIG